MPDETVEERLQALETLQNTLVKSVRDNRITKIELIRYFETIILKLTNTLGDFQIDLIKDREALQENQKETAKQ